MHLRRKGRICGRFHAYRKRRPFPRCPSAAALEVHAPQTATVRPSLAKAESRRDMAEDPDARRGCFALWGQPAGESVATPLHQGGDCGWRAEVADTRACTLSAGPASLTLARGASTLTCRHTGLRLQKDAGPASRVVRPPMPAYRRQRPGGNPPPLPPPPLPASRDRDPSPGQKPGCGGWELLPSVIRTLRRGVGA